MAMSGFELFTCRVARATGVMVGLFGAYDLVVAVRSQLAAPAVLGVVALGLSLGLWLLHPAALRVTPGVLVLMAIILPIGLVNPFAALEAPGQASVSGYLSWQIALGFGLSALCVTIAHLIGLARLSLARHGVRAKQ